MKIILYFIYYFVSFFILYSFFNLVFFKKFNVYQILIATLIFAILMTLYVYVLKGNKNKK
ncbi:hypothetical protein BUZ11_13850 [Staphylococcus gallinarum]|uniref:Uncharacterized protein n=1 Tax=Staphylococcus gallinarum TaxID=1293 RepID=A0A2T4SWU4_STAGA|nr:hypothetical protein [Staphylococcus gallinarum]PTL06089.1 hypothetical protein BUZ09_12695 [Staphylococcus gallinarum]PTL09635.1 hypothetical protein BUZ15_07485 [Staphylococcus gallinarum]RIL35493.1 hypothetical protein BUY98_01050 [Staphylococcus gallinarum]RIL43165.1 hypothetical protein BUZ01_05985 [Staphylococcus gallinarum]RIO79501.1 hypothetical protein BUZ11_13850 [Staphylococcus gallinarum]